MGFVFRLIPPRPGFAFDMSPEERAIMIEHAGYWGELAERGRAVAFGPVNDPAGSYGIGIVLAEDLADAQELGDADPAIRSGRGFRTEIAPMLALVTPAGRFDGAAG
jgi:uncharacterized protein YciI